MKSPLFVLAKITQFLGIIGLGMIIFGVFFSKLFIKIVYTEKWATDVIIYVIISNIVNTINYASILHLYIFYGFKWSN